MTCHCGAPALDGLSKPLCQYHYDVLIFGQEWADKVKALAVTKPVVPAAPPDSAVVFGQVFAETFNRIQREYAAADAAKSGIKRSPDKRRARRTVTGGEVGQRDDELVTDEEIDT